MIVESVVSFVTEKICDFLSHEAIFLHNVRDRVEWVEAELRSMQAFLKDATMKQMDERVKNWVSDVRDVAYDAEDVIDTFLYKTEVTRRRGSVGYVKRLTSLSDEMSARRELGKEIKQIKKKLLEISQRRLTFGIKDIGSEGGEGSSSMGGSLREQRRTSPLLVETEIVGFREDIETLVARLIRGESWRCVTSVVGMGGLGKTTLARKVYNNDSIEKHFKHRAWIYVSQEYDVKDLLLSIIRCFMVPTTIELEMNAVQLQERLLKYLKDETYLVVLDDIWKTDAWDALAPAFPDMSNGSRVLLTTRNKDVALYADAKSRMSRVLLSTPCNRNMTSHSDAQSCLHELQILGKEESWELFCKKTFLEQDNCCPEDLERLGREIVAKCHGLPLAIVVIAGLLSRKSRLPSEWEKVIKSISWQFVQGEAQISKILALSYEDLPYQVKSCFLYLGVFPEDSEFSARKLIELWVAEGFIESRGGETLEEVAEDFLGELIQRSLVQIAERSSTGGVKSCRVHDLLRDLSIAKAKEENFLHVHSGDSDSLPPSKARRLVIHHRTGKEIYPNHPTPQLRSILRFNLDFDRFKKYSVMFLYGGFQFLRVLHLHQIDVEEVPCEIGTLIHLRYLGITAYTTKLKSLPWSISRLYNLETLHIASTSIFIPFSIWKMQQLRHVHLVSGKITGEGSKEGALIALGLNCLGSLQTLANIEAGDWIEDFLGKLSNLRKLGILGDDLSRHSKGLSESISKLDQLRSLKLRVTSPNQIPVLMPLSHQRHLYKLWLDGRLEKLPESHEFSANLTKLTLRGSYLQQDPMTTLEKLTNLRVLRLLDSSYVGRKMICSAQGFPRLESLRIRVFHYLEEWRIEEGALRCLLHLHIYQCLRLKALPEGLQHVTSLKKLELWKMIQLIPRLQEGVGEDWCKIQNIPSIDMQ